MERLHSAGAVEVVPTNRMPPDVASVEIVTVEIAAVETARVERLPDVTGDVELPPMRGRPPDVASVKIATVKTASVERLCNAVSTIEVAPFEEKLPDVANAMVAAARDMMFDVANVQMASLRETSDSVHVVSPPMASVSCGLGHLTETYRNVARAAKVYCSLACIAIVFSVAVVVVVSFIVLGHEMVRCCARVSRIVESTTSDIAQCCFHCCSGDRVANPCVPVTPVQSIADSTCSPALPFGKRALLHDSQANAEISRIGPRGKGEVREMIPTLGKWQQCTRGRKCVTSCKHTLKMRIIKKSGIK